MMAADASPQLRPFDGAAIPQALKDLPRWAPWVAVWNAKRGKYDKIPRRADVPEYGLSTANPDRWFTYAAALAAYERERPSLAGVGYVMTRPHGVVGVDLDDCVHDGVIAPWAQEIVDGLASYTEVSPSGHGLRIFALGEVADWTNHTVGVEVYGGAEPRFLTITGQHLVGTPTDVHAAGTGVLEGLRAQYGREATKTEGPAVDMPELLTDLVLPDLASLDLPYAARDFLEQGDCKGDRSRELHAAAVALYQCGLADDEVFSMLAASPYAMEVALDHRRQDSDRALLYLWKEHCMKAKGKGERRVATSDDFDDVSEPAAPGAAPAQAAGKPMRFPFQTLDDFEKGKPLSWLVKRVLPKAELGAVYGPSKAGKSFFVLDLVYAIARGVEWRGRRVTQGTVGYICAEGARGFRLRTRAFREYHGIAEAPAGLRILDGGPNFMERQDIRDLVASLKSLPQMPDLLVVDTLAQVIPGANENSAEDMGRALAHCKALHRATGAMVLLVAHTGKDEARGMRGSSVVLGALDVEIAVARSDEYRAATITKMKDGEGEGDEYAFRLERVVVGADEDGEDITTAVALPTNHVPAAQRRTEPKGVWQQVVMRVAQTITAMNDLVTTNEVIEAAVSDMPAPEAGKKDRRHRDALRAIESLVAANRLSTTGGRVEVL